MKNITRFIWISNLPTNTSEDELRRVLGCFGKIQCVKFLNDGAIATFIDGRSASKAVESGVKLHKTTLKLQFCESPDNFTSEQKLEQRSDSVSDSKSVVGEIDTESTSSSCSSRSSSPRIISRKKSYSPNRREQQRPNGESDDRLSKSGNTTRETSLRGLKITHLSLRSTDSNLREGLFHEYKKHGKITSLVIRGSGSSRYAHITFKLPEDAEKAYEHSRDKVFFGVPVHAELVEGLDIEDPDLCPPEHALDEYHPKATKTLFVGNLCSATITQDELLRVFRDYGEIIEIDIKTQNNQPGTSYAFVQFTDIKSVVRALSDQERVLVDGKSVKLGFGKSQPCSVVWLDNLSPSVTDGFLSRQLARYGRLKDILLDMKLNRALVYFETAEAAQRALNETRNRSFLGKKVQIDFASVECQLAFISKLHPREGPFSKFGDRCRELVEGCLPGGGTGLAGYLEEGRGLQKLRHKEIALLFGLSTSGSRLNKSYGSSRSSHNISSRNVSPTRSLYARNSPARDFNNTSGSILRGGNSIMSNFIGLTGYGKHDSSRDRSKYSQSRKSMGPSSHGMTNGGGSYQHSGGYNGTEISPHRQVSSWNSSRRSQYAASTCSESSSVERKSDFLKRDASHSHKYSSEHQRSSIKRKSSHRTGSDRHRYTRDDPVSPQMSSISRRHLRESAGSTPESNQPSKSTVESANGESHILPSRNLKSKHSELKTSPNSESNGDTLSKLHQERVELLVKLNQLSSMKKTDTESSNQYGYDGVDSTKNGSGLLQESDAIPVPQKRMEETATTGADFPVSGSAGQSSSSDPGDAIFSPNSSGVPQDRISSPPPPPPPPPLTNRLACGVVPSPGVINHSPNQATFDPIPPLSPPPQQQQTKLENSYETENRSRNSPILQLSLPPFSSYSSVKQSLDSDTELTGLESYLTSNSIDERIRQLDEQFKIRPHVDYSRFRIRRKSDISSSSSANNANSLSSNSLLSSGIDTKKSTFNFLQSPLPDSSLLGLPEIRSSNTRKIPDTSEFIKSMLSASGSTTLKSAIIEPSPITSHPSLPPIPPLSAPVPLLNKNILSPITTVPPPQGRGEFKASSPRSLLSPINSAPPTQPAPPPPPPASSKLSERMKPVLHFDKPSPSHIPTAQKARTLDITSPPSSNKPALSDAPNIGGKHKQNSSIAPPPHFSPKSPKLLGVPKSAGNDDYSKLNGISSPPLSKPLERSGSPPLNSSKKTREIPSSQTTPRRQLISPPTMPFERNKLHFKKLPKVDKIPPSSKEPKLTPISAPPIKSIRSPSLNGSEGRSKGREESGVRSKKKLRRRRTESDEDDWKPHGGSGSVSSEFLKADDLTDGGHYETMYDKIKRRGNKDASSDRLESKPEALKSLLKSRKNKAGKEDDSESQSAKPPHLTPESMETSSRRSTKKSRLKRPDSEGGSSSDSDSPRVMPPAKRRRFTPASRKRRVSNDDASSATPKSKATSRKRLKRPTTVYSSNESANESDSNVQGFFPESRRHSRRSNSSSTTSTPQISRSCSPVECLDKSDLKDDEEHLPLLEKQIPSDQEDIEELTPIVEPAVEEEAQEAVEEEIQVKNEGVEEEQDDVIPDIEPKVEEMEIEEKEQEEMEVEVNEKQEEEKEKEEEEEEVLVIDEQPENKPEVPKVKPSVSEGCRSSAGSDLIFTSPIVMPVVPTKSDSTDDFEDDSRLVIDSNAVSGEPEPTDTVEVEVPTESKSYSLTPVQPQQQQQPVTLIAPVSVIPASTSNQRLALVVNALGPNQGDGSAQPTLVLTPSFSIVGGVQQPAQLIINSAAPSAASQLIQNVPIVENKPPPPPPVHPEVAAPIKPNVSDSVLVQHFAEQAKAESSPISSGHQEKGRRSGGRRSGSGHQKNISPRVVSTEIKPQFVPPPISVPAPTTTASNLPVDPYEPDFDEPESEVIPSAAHPPPAARKDTVTEVINSVVHGDFEQNDYVQRLSSSSRLSSVGPSNSSSSTTPKDSVQDVVPKADIFSQMASTPVNSSLNNINLDTSKPDVYSRLPSVDIVTTVAQNVKLEPVSMDVYPASSHPLEILTTPQSLPTSSIISPAVEVPHLASFSESRPSLLITRECTVQSPAANVVTEKPVTHIPQQQISRPQTLIEVTQQQMEDRPSQPVPAQPTGFLNPLHVLTLMAPNLSQTSGDAAVVAQQISPQVQPQLGSFAASLIYTLFGEQAKSQQQQQAQSEPPFLAHSVPQQQNSDLTLQNPYPPPPPPPSLNENYLLLEPRFLEDKFSLLWRGCLSLKSDRVSVRMLYLAGNQDIVLSCLNVLTGSEDPSSASGVLRITQRMRLESTQLEGVQRKLREPSNYCMCLALASSSTHNLVAERNDMLNQIISFQNMISYLQDKTAAGIISCSSGHENPYVMHMFPPCDFTTSQLNFLSEDLQQTLHHAGIPFMLIIVV